MEATQLLANEITPFAANEGSLRELQARIKDWLVRNKVRSHPEVVSAVKAAMARREGAGEAGREEGGSSTEEALEVEGEGEKAEEGLGLEGAGKT